VTDTNGPDTSPRLRSDGTLTTGRPSLAGVGILGIVGLLCIPFLVLAVFLGYEEIRFAVDGSQAVGTVTNRTIGASSGKYGSTSYIVDYTFLSASSDQQISGSNPEMTQSDWEKLTIGSPITIQYQRSDPQENRPSLSRTGTPILGVVIFGILGLAGGFFELTYVRSLWRRRHSRPAANRVPPDTGHSNGA
jgi:Protein of unknown function (DUF3592)